MTREEFIVGYVGRSSIAREEFDRYFIALPCECQEQDCEGWAAIPREGRCVLDHFRMYKDSSILLRHEMESRSNPAPALGGGDGAKP